MIMLEPKTRVPKSNKKEDASKSLKKKLVIKKLIRTTKRLFFKL